MIKKKIQDKLKTVRRITLEQCQKLYEIGNEEVRNELIKFFDKSLLEGDFEDYEKNLHGYIPTGTQNYVEIGTVKSLKYKLHYEDYKHYERNVKEYLYKDFCNLEEDQPVILLWKIPRTDYDDNTTPNYLTGFYTIDNKYEHTK